MSARLIDVAPGPVVGVAGTRLAEIGDGWTVMVTAPTSAPPKPSVIVYVNESVPKKPGSGVYVHSSDVQETCPCEAPLAPEMASASWSASVSLASTSTATGVS